ncbi:hypothetical protein FXO38_09339 [Capsicum annuum]|uniref:Uncharacterized protein n=1 Tax=Capsicum annuum TaxID=4072 RepID=A0A2G2ZMZ4_CAPAN|nr:hypothetical protein FXO37_33308 [Capsicum annuum]KAF3665863.1 hypothetical protein FXO38_09339 [Capsicum annuum]PHT83359.1 hypothetical protein T459_11802 [Capsicum annuum]
MALLEITPMATNFLVTLNKALQKVELMLKLLQAASFGGSNIDLSAWVDKNNPGESRFLLRIFCGLNLPSPLSITSNNNHSSTISASWSTTPCFSDFQEADLVSPSASTILYPPLSTNGINNSTMNSSAPPFCCNGKWT